MYLNCKTYFSFRWGTYSTTELVDAAVAAGASALALTNINNTCDAWDFVLFCRQRNIKPIVGAEIRNGDTLLYILIAASNRGFAWINHFISKHAGLDKPFPAQSGDEPFFLHASHGFVIYPLDSKPLEKLFPNEYIGVQPAEVNKLFGRKEPQYRDKLVVRQPVTFQDKKHFNAHRLLRAIDKNELLSRVPASTLCGSNEFFLAQDKILEAFKQFPFIFTNTFRLMDACEIKMDFGSDKNKKTFSARKKDDAHLLRKLALDGLQARYGTNSIAAKQRVDKELDIINQLGFNSYFLMTWDIIRYAHQRGFYYVGRGSGANSIVAYCLRITDVDPIELDLYFERFLNPYRTSPPDFDIDFSWLDRDEVIDYIFKRYGEDHVALVGSYSTFQFNAIIRELGKVFGLPKGEIDELGEKGYYYGETRVQNFVKHEKQDHIHSLILQYGKLINNFPNHLSVHAGGMLISEEPLHAYTATFLPPKNFITSQIDMYLAESIGLAKLDILSQRGLGHIKETLRLVRQNKQINIDITQVEKFKEDPVVCDQIRNVNTIGCFYVESPAMRQLLKKLKCDNYLMLVAASSIIRPGVASSGMMKEYISRFHNPKGFQYLHPIIEELLSETFGVMVYQEDVIKVAHYYGGLDMGEADVLRRAMSGKYRSNNRFALMREKFFANCKERGRPENVSVEVWRQMESFAGYSFSKAHSASFAVESFQDLFLKANYPMEFMVGVINNFGGYYHTSLYFYELIKTGANIHLPCVNNSEYLTSIRGIDVHVGLIHIKELEKAMGDKILDERNCNGPYLHLHDFIERTAVTLEQLNILISIGAFRFTGKNKKQLLWEANFLQKRNKTHVPSRSALFQEKPIDFALPELSDNPLDDIYDEMEILGFALRNPFEIVDDDPSMYMLANDLPNHLGKEVTMLTYFVTDKIVPTKNKNTMSFGTFLDAKLNWLDTVHFPDAYKNFPMQGKGFYKIKGRVVEDFGFHSLEVLHMKKVGYKERKYANL
jgi:DNA polymerase-3 subunit alpha